MFLLNSCPLNACFTFGRFGYYFLTRWIETYFDLGIKQLHVIFDNCSNDNIGPKDITRKVRDNDQNGTITRDFDSISEETCLPAKDWMSFLKNRHNKSLLCHFLSMYIANHGHKLCNKGESIIVAGGFIGKMKNKALLINSSI